MPGALKASEYQALLNQIDAIYARAQYGQNLITILSKDLTAKFGSGFSERNLLYMWQFYRAYPSIPQAPAELDWTRHPQIHANRRLYQRCRAG